MDLGINLGVERGGLRDEPGGRERWTGINVGGGVERGGLRDEPGGRERWT